VKTLPIFDCPIADWYLHENVIGNQQFALGEIVPRYARSAMFIERESNLNELKQL
jgi:hypothetical protein